MKERILVILICFPLGLYAQSVTHSAGGDIQTEKGSASYSIGQVFSQSVSHSAGFVSEGVQQAYEIYQEPIENQEDMSLVWGTSVYPNPVKDILTLQCNEKAKGSQYLLMSIEGKVFQKGKVMNLQTEISIQSYKASVYVLRLQNADGKAVVYRIIKN